MSLASFFAHSSDKKNKASWHALSDHLVGTGNRAAKFLEPVGFTEIGRAAGLLHALGKYSLAFQDMLGVIRAESIIPGPEQSSRYNGTGRPMTSFLRSASQGTTQGSPTGSAARGCGRWAIVWPQHSARESPCSTKVGGLRSHCLRRPGPKPAPGQPGRPRLRRVIPHTHAAKIWHL